MKNFWWGTYKHCAALPHTPPPHLANFCVHFPPLPYLPPPSPGTYPPSTPVSTWFNVAQYMLYDTIDPCYCITVIRSWHNMLFICRHFAAWFLIKIYECTFIFFFRIGIPKVSTSVYLLEPRFVDNHPPDKNLTPHPFMFLFFCRHLQLSTNCLQSFSY